MKQNNNLCNTTISRFPIHGLLSTLFQAAMTPILSCIHMILFYSICKYFVHNELYKVTKENKINMFCFKVEQSFYSYYDTECVREEFRRDIHFFIWG